MPSLGQTFHQSRLIIDPSSEVGACCHCACHFCSDKDALTPSNSSNIPELRPHWFIIQDWLETQPRPTDQRFRLFVAANNFPVRSFVDHRVMTITIEPPGCKRCLGPEVYHSYALSMAV